MRIGVLNWRDQSHSGAGGAEVYIHEVAKRWAELGHDVALYSSGTRYLEPDEKRDAYVVRRRGRLLGGTHHLKAPIAVGRDEPDVVLESINTFPYLLPIRRLKCPFVSLIHQLGQDVWNSHMIGPLAAIARAGERALFIPYRSRQVLAVSNSTAEDLHRMGIGKVVTIPQGGLGHQSLRDKTPSVSIVFVGRLAANKRPDHAIAAFGHVREQIPDAQLFIVGEGPMASSLARGEEGVALLGRIDREELLQVMGEAHLLWSTSVREGWGLVVTEANALGTPAVAYDVPGLRDSVKHDRTGVLVPPDAYSLAMASVALLKDSRRYEDLRDAAIEWGQSFNWDTTASVLLGQLVNAADGERTHVVDP
jgi:glycosyltransferase involved in cell wall biosynthesis